jgi:plasmid stabilization system protein ParE
MSPVFKVYISRTAESDIEEAYLWWSEHRSRVQANKWYGSILDSIKTLSSMPERCPLADEATDLGTQVRQLLFGIGGGRPTHRILFRFRTKPFTSSE